MVLATWRSWAAPHAPAIVLLGLLIGSTGWASVRNQMLSQDSRIRALDWASASAPPSGATVACLCSSDQVYAELGEATAAVLKQAGASQVLVRCVQPAGPFVVDGVANRAVRGRVGLHCVDAVQLDLLRPESRHDHRAVESLQALHLQVE